MSSVATRWVRVDRSSPSLEFDGTSGLQTGGNFTDSLKFVFSGSEVIFWVNAYDSQRGDDRPPPPFNFTVDGVPATFALNGDKWRYSWEGEATSTPRTVLFNRTSSTETTMSTIIVWYRPSPSSPPLEKGSWAEFTHSDPAIQYKGDWIPQTENGEIGTGATKTGSSLEFTFTGSRVWWEGRYSGSDVPSAYTSSHLGAYNIDGGASKLFYPFDNSASFNPGQLTHAVVPLTADELDEGQHTLTLVTDVVVDETLPDPPVVLFNLLVEQGSFLVGESVTNPSRTSSVTSKVYPTTLPSGSSLPASTSDKGSVSTGAIVGGVVGGIAALAILIIALLWFRRRKAKRHDAVYDQPTEPFVSQPHPFSPASQTAQSYSPITQSGYHSYPASDTASHSAGGSHSITTFSSQPYAPPIHRKGQPPELYPVSPSDASRDTGSSSAGGNLSMTTSSNPPTTFPIDRKGQPLRLYPTSPSDISRDTENTTFPRLSSDSGTLPPAYTAS